ncbi:MAG: hypothetical protein JXR88_11015 [Clostridia bacterium]|nr:hypothetical protein [Clostridia bacterium]
MKTKLIKPFKSIMNTLPMMIGIILLLGLVKEYITFDRIGDAFTQNAFLDTGIGALLGSIFAGNSMNSYIIARELQTIGISLFAITAFLVSWVTVGILQAPLEADIFGKRFAILRNIYSGLLSMAVAFVTVAIWRLF